MLHGHALRAAGRRMGGWPAVEVNACACVLWSHGRRGDAGSVSVSGGGERIGRASETESGRF